MESYCSARWCSQFPVVEAVVSTVLDELDEQWPRAIGRRVRLLVRLAFFVLLFVAGIPLVMEVLRLYSTKRDETSPTHCTVHLLACSGIITGERSQRWHWQMHIVL